MQTLGSRFTKLYRQNPRPPTGLPLNPCRTGWQECAWQTRRTGGTQMEDEFPGAQAPIYSRFQLFSPSETMSTSRSLLLCLQLYLVLTAARETADAMEAHVPQEGHHDADRKGDTLLDTTLGMEDSHGVQDGKTSLEADTDDAVIPGDGACRRPHVRILRPTTGALSLRMYVCPKSLISRACRRDAGTAA